MTALAWLPVAILLLLLSLVGLRYLLRGTPVRRVRRSGLHGGGTLPDRPAIRGTLELLAGMRFTDGNQAEFLSCGDDTYPRLFADLRAARRSITLQMYYCKPGRVADELREVLVDRARAGIHVLTLWDAFGSGSLRGEYMQALRDAGVTVAVFRPVRWYALEKAYNRSHIRVVVVDGRVAYTGGFGVDDKWLGSGRRKGEWRDTNVRFTGPAVAGLQATFAAGWAEATGDLLTGGDFYDDGHDQEGHGVVAGVLHAAPTIGSTSAERFLALFISAARQRLYIANSYFVPDEDFRNMLCAAADRGVDVRLLAPGPTTDVRSTRMASHASYEALLRAGVRLFEYEPSMMHAKSMVVDGCMGWVGTMNFDNRSLAFNDESNFVFLDERLGRDLEALFVEDLAFSTEYELESFVRRPWTERLQERAFSALTRIL